MTHKWCASADIHWPSPEPWGKTRTVSF